MADGVCELLWIKDVLDDLKIKCDDPISLAHNPFQHGRTKHIQIDRHFTKGKIESGLICTPYVSTQDQLADVFTKGLSNSGFQIIISKLEGECRKIYINLYFIVIFYYVRISHESWGLKDYRLLSF